MTYPDQKLTLTWDQVSDKSFEVVKYLYHSVHLDETNTMVGAHAFSVSPQGKKLYVKTVFVKTVISRSKSENALKPDIRELFFSFRNPSVPRNTSFC